MLHYVAMRIKELKRIRTKELEMTQAELARVLGVQRNTVTRWEMGLVKPPKVVELAINYLLLKKKGEKPNAKSKNF